MTPLSSDRPALAALFLPALFLAALFSGCGRQRSAGPVRTGFVSFAPGREISGIAPSRRAENLYWIHNDSGEPVLYAIDARGRLRGSLRVNKTKNVDWEDIASFELDGHSWLMAGDVGDNQGNRRNYALRVIAEPDPADLSPEKELAGEVVWSTPVVYPDGPHDCEAIAVDARDEIVYLLTKRMEPPVLYSLPLRPPAAGPTPAAVLVARLAGLPQPNSTQRVLPTPTGRYRARPTALDIAPDGNVMAVLTYGDVLLFARRPGEGWAAAVARAPEILAPHNLPQAEALCFSREGGSIYVSGEQKNPPLLRYEFIRATRP